MGEDPGILIDRVLAFAQDDDGIDAVILTGSRARGSGVDRFSDLDIELIGPGSRELTGRDGWLAAFGEVLVALHLENGGRDEPEWPTCLCVFAGGRKIDFMLAGPQRLENMRRHGLDDLYLRGYRILLDKGSFAADLPTSRPTPPRKTPPDQEQFERNLRGFWFEATQIAVCIARNELWFARFRDHGLKVSLLTMLEWFAVSQTPESDTWYHGRHIRDWLAPPWYEKVEGAFGCFDIAEATHSLIATVDLYEAVSIRTATALGLRADVVPAGKIRDLIAATLSA